MKVYFTYILFLAFALRPAYNLGYVAYFELNIDYIVDTYCVNKKKIELKCNGKCHLSKQLSLDSVNQEENVSDFSVFAEAFFPVYFQEYNYINTTSNTNNSLLNNWCYNNLFISIFKDCLDPPPRLV